MNSYGCWAWWSKSICFYMAVEGQFLPPTAALGTKALATIFKKQLRLQKQISETKNEVFDLCGCSCFRIQHDFFLLLCFGSQKTISNHLESCISLIHVHMALLLMNYLFIPARQKATKITFLHPLLAMCLLRFSWPRLLCLVWCGCIGFGVQHNHCLLRFWDPKNTFRINFEGPKD